MGAITTRLGSFRPLNVNGWNRASADKGGSGQGEAADLAARAARASKKISGAGQLCRTRPVYVPGVLGVGPAGADGVESGLAGAAGAPGAADWSVGAELGAGGAACGSAAGGAALVSGVAAGALLFGIIPACGAGSAAGAGVCGAVAEGWAAAPVGAADAVAA